MTNPIRLGNVTIECPDVRALGQFYAAITDGEVTFANDGWATMRCPGGRIDFQTSPGHVPPTWPDRTSSMQFHLDFAVDDLDAAEALVIAAGASRYDHQPNGFCRVFADPAGHPFCLSTHDVDEPV